MAKYVQWPNAAAVTRRIPKVRLLAARFWRTPGGFLREGRNLPENNSDVARTSAIGNDRSRRKCTLGHE
jgi:hypothetical protein